MPRCTIFSSNGQGRGERAATVRPTRPCLRDLISVPRTYAAGPGGRFGGEYTRQDPKAKSRQGKNGYAHTTVRLTVILTTETSQDLDHTRANAVSRASTSAVSAGQRGIELYHQQTKNLLVS